MTAARNGALAALLCLAVPVAAAAGSAELERALHHRGFAKARVGVLVVDAASGTEIFARNADTPLTPASNQKILTAVATLATFGPAHQFTTEIRADRSPDAHGSVGTLYVRGGGDPSLTSEELWRLAADLYRAGLRRVSGDLVLDASAFEAQDWNPAWGAASARAFHAPVAALSVNYGAFAVEARPGAKAGAPLLVSIDPPLPWLTLRNRSTTGKGNASLAVDRRAAEDADEVIVSGSLPLGAEPTTVFRSVTDNVRYAGGVLRMQLAALGIPIDGRIRTGQTPAGAPDILAFRGKSLAEIARLFLKNSNNNIAETLLKDLSLERLGEPGSWTGGVRVLREQLASLGIDCSTCTLLDGSGLAAANKVPPRAFVAALRAARSSFAFGPEFVSALPVAGEDGTLEKRAAAVTGRVRAKTGLLNGVTGLSGYARRRDGSEVVFSILANGYANGDVAAMSAVDGFLTALVN